jgi:hypothetical protein
MDLMSSILLRRLAGRGGFSLLAAIGLLLLLGFTGASVVQVASADRQMVINDIYVKKALYAGNGGIEWAIHQIDNGEDPRVKAQPLGGGTFAVAAEAATRTLTVTGWLAHAERIQRVNTPFAADCAGLSLGSATLITQQTFSEMHEVRIKKTCFKKITLVGMAVSWEMANGFQKVVRIDLAGQTIYNGGTGVGGPGGGAASGDAITVKKTGIAVSQTLSFAPIVFNTVMPTNTSYTVETFFQDGSSVFQTKVF